MRRFERDEILDPDILMNYPRTGLTRGYGENKRWCAGRDYRTYPYLANRAQNDSSTNYKELTMEFQSLITDYFIRISDELERVLDGLTIEELSKHPAPGANSIDWLGLASNPEP